MLILVFVSVIVLGLRFGVKPISDLLGIKERAGLRVESNPSSTVLVDGVEVGKTPFESDQMKTGYSLVELKAVGEGGGELSWKGNVPLVNGTVTVVNRDLASSVATSSGEVIVLEKGKGVNIISSPDGAEVVINGKEYGKTPLSVEELGAGEHVFIVGRANYLKRSIKAALIEGYKLNVSVDLALSEADLTKILTTPLETSQEVVIKRTPTGFLRVRSEASTNSPEVGRVNPGETLILLEEVPNWFRIRLPDGKEGYISSQYAEKKK